MIYSLRGNVSRIFAYSLVLENSGVGYEVMVSRPNKYNVNDELTLFIHEVLKEDEHYLVGFDSLEEKELFLKLITVKGLGPKGSIKALGASNVDTIINAIQCNNLLYLKRLPGFGSKIAEQILLDLKGKFDKSIKMDIEAYNDAYKGLIQLGFKKNAVENVLSTINDPDLDAAGLIRVALSKLPSPKGANKR